MQNSQDQKGFSAVEAIVIVIIVALLGVGGWLIYSKQSKTSNSSTDTQQTDNKDEEDQPAAIKLSFLGVEFTPTSPFKDIVTTSSTSEDGTPLVAFSTQELKDLEDNEYCDKFGPNKTDAPFHLGMLFKVSGTYPTEATDENVIGRLVKQFDGYNIQYREPADYCFVAKANEEQVDQQQKELYKVLQQSIKEIK